MAGWDSAVLVASNFSAAATQTSSGMLSGGRTNSSSKVGATVNGSFC